MQIKFEVNGVAQLSRNLSMLSNDLSSRTLSEFHKEAIKLVEEKSMNIFKSKGKNVKKSPIWKPLAKSTQKARSNRTGYYKQAPIATNMPLVWTGNLKNSRKKQSNKLFGSLEFTADYAKYHQNGGRNLPQRAIIDFDNETNTKIVKSLQDIVRKKIKNYNLF